MRARQEDVRAPSTTSDWDPFGFSAGIHDDVVNDHSCAIDASWSGVMSPWTPDPARSGPTDGGVRALLSKTTNHDNGVVWIDRVEYRAHGTGIGTLWTGVGLDG